MINKKILALAFLLFHISTSVEAAFILNGTRFIYDEGRNNISFEISNESKSTYGSQVWIENVESLNSDVSFIPMPAFSKIAPKSTQIVRLRKVNSKLDQDKESLFWLNVQEIPPLYKGEGNKMTIAVNTKVKLIYRPELLKEGRKDAESKLFFSKNEESYQIVNPTPYYFAIISFSKNGNKIKLKEDTYQKISMMAPFSEIIINEVEGLELSGIKIEAIDDYGAINNYEVN